MEGAGNCSMILCTRLPSRPCQKEYTSSPYQKEYTSSPYQKEYTSTPPKPTLSEGVCLHTSQPHSVGLIELRWPLTPPPVCLPYYPADLERVVLERASEVLHTIQLVLEAERRARVLAADEAGGGDVGHELVVNKDACVHRVRERALAKQRVRHVDRQLDVAERAVALGRGLGQRLEAVHGPRVVGVLPLRVQSARAIQCKRAELRLQNERG
eukprot:364420-Chlamydomonas_euryale.AAC.1